MSIRVLIADDQQLIRVGLRTILSSAVGIEVVGEAADGQQAVDVAGAARPDVVLMDVRMPHMDGITATEQLRGIADPPAVILFTTFDLDEYVYRGLRAGASAFLLKDMLADDLIAAIHTVAEGDAVVAPAATRRLIERYVRTGPEPDNAAARSLERLTDRERDVLLHVARGYTNAEVAAMLYVSEGTIKTHIGHIFSKLDLRDRVQAVVLAYESGLITPGS